MKTCKIKVLVFLTAMMVGTAQAEPIIESVQFSGDNEDTKLMVAVDMLAVFDLFKPKNPVRHMEFDSDSPLNFVQVDPDAEMIARLLEKYGDEDEETHWSRNAGKYKTAAVVAAIGTAVAFIVSESKESSGRDQTVTAGGNVNFNTGTIGGNNGNAEGETATFEGIE